MSRDSAKIIQEWLVVNAQMGDADALQQLLRSWYPKLLRYALRQLNHKGQAEDAVQNTLEAVCTKLTSLKDPAAFAKWSYKILHFKCVDVIRKNQRQRIDKKDIEQNEQYSHADDSEQTLHVEQVMDQLDTQSYQLLHLHYLEGLSIRAISDILNIAEGTVKSRLFKVRKSLQLALKGESNG